MAQLLDGLFQGQTFRVSFTCHKEGSDEVLTLGQCKCISAPVPRSTFIFLCSLASWDHWHPLCTVSHKKAEVEFRFTY